jgi:hypothetical protein
MLLLHSFPISSWHGTLLLETGVDLLVHPDPWLYSQRRCPPLLSYFSTFYRPPLLLKTLPPPLSFFATCTYFTSTFHPLPINLT